MSSKSFNGKPQQQEVTKMTAAAGGETIGDESNLSIAEAVAFAHAEEAIAQKEKWEKEKVTLLKEAEDAARARVENDLQIQQRRLTFDKWKYNLEKERKQKRNVFQKKGFSCNFLRASFLKFCWPCNDVQ